MDFTQLESAARMRTSRDTSSQSFESEEKDQVSMVPSQFAFFNFKSTGLEKTLANFVNASSLLPQFVQGDVVIFHSKDYDFSHQDFGFLMAMKQNKPFDVLVYMHAVTTNQYDENKAMFHFKIDEEVDQGTFVKNTTMLVFSYLLYMTRGNLPRKSSSSSKNPLPKLLKDILGDPKIMLEEDFANNAASFDLGKLDARFFLNMDPKNLPEQIVNRIRKGSAGSRSLKFFKMVMDYPDKNMTGFSAHEISILKVLSSITGLSQSYLSLHPANQTVQSQIKDFYPSVLSLGARLIGQDNWATFLAGVRQIPTFDKDKVLQSLSIRNGEIYINSNKFEHGFKSIDPAKLELLFGTPY